MYPGEKCGVANRVKYSDWKPQRTQCPGAAGGVGNRTLGGIRPPGSRQGGTCPGLNTSALRPPGMNTSGIRPPGMNTSGIRPPGMNTSGMRPPGMNTSGIRPPGMNTSGMRPPGMNTSGMRPPGMNTSGMRPPGMNTSALRPPGMNTSCLRPPGMNTSVLRPPGMNTSALRPPGMNTSAIRGLAPSQQCPAAAPPVCPAYGGNVRPPYQQTTTTTTNTSVSYAPSVAPPASCPQTPAPSKRRSMAKGPSLPCIVESPVSSPAPAVETTVIKKTTKIIPPPEQPPAKKLTPQERMELELQMQREQLNALEARKQELLAMQEQNKLQKKQKKLEKKMKKEMEDDQRVQQAKQEMLRAQVELQQMKEAKHDLEVQIQQQQLCELREQQARQRAADMEMAQETLRLCDDRNALRENIQAQKMEEAFQKAKSEAKAKALKQMKQQQVKPGTPGTLKQQRQQGAIPKGTRRPPSLQPPGRCPAAGKKKVAVPVKEKPLWNPNTDPNSTALPVVAVPVTVVPPPSLASFAPPLKRAQLAAKQTAAIMASLAKEEMVKQELARSRTCPAAAGAAPAEPTVTVPVATVGGCPSMMREIQVPASIANSPKETIVSVSKYTGVARTLDLDFEETFNTKLPKRPVLNEKMGSTLPRTSQALSQFLCNLQEADRIERRELGDAVENVQRNRRNLLFLGLEEQLLNARRMNRSENSSQLWRERLRSEQIKIDSPRRPAFADIGGCEVELVDSDDDCLDEAAAECPAEMGIMSMMRPELYDSGGSSSSSASELDLPSILRSSRQTAASQSVCPAARPVCPAVRPVSPVARPVCPAARPVSPVARPVCPAARPVSPEARSMSFEARSMSPVARPVCPEARSMSPEARSMSPKARSMSPEARSMSPEARSVCPASRDVPIGNLLDFSSECIPDGLGDNFGSPSRASVLAPGGTIIEDLVQFLQASPGGPIIETHTTTSRTSSPVPPSPVAPSSPCRPATPELIDWGPDPDLIDWMPPPETPSEQLFRLVKVYDVK